MMAESVQARSGGNTAGTEVSRPHSLWVSGREEITVRGVTEVLSFDENSVRLTTSRGPLTLEGQGMRVTALDTEGGVVSVTGLLFGAFYTDESDSDGRQGDGRNRGRFLRLFR